MLILASFTFSVTARIKSLLESNPVVAQGRRHRAARDTTIQIRLIEIPSDLRRPFQGYPHGVFHDGKAEMISIGSISAYGRWKTGL